MLFHELVPDRYNNQLQRAGESPEFVIDGTAFSTVTVNYSWRTALHRDKGDFEDGFGNGFGHGFGHGCGRSVVMEKVKLEEENERRVCDTYAQQPAWRDLATASYITHALQVGSDFGSGRVVLRWFGGL